MAVSTEKELEKEAQEIADAPPIEVGDKIEPLVPEFPEKEEKQ